MKKIFLLSLLLLLVQQSFGAAWFVRSGSSGSGTSWSNAWAGPGNIVWSSISAGDTICIAGGTYSGTGIVPTKSGASGNPITIKRAFATDAICGSTSSGWNSSFDAQVFIPNGILLQAVNFITIDGQVFNGINTTTTAAQCTGGNDCIGIDILGPTNGIVLRNIESAGPCAQAPCTYNGVFQSIRIGENFQPNNNFLFQFLNLHGGCDNMHLIEGTGTIEHSRFADSENNNSGCHENVIEGGEGGVTITFRYNEWVNWGVEGIMMCPTSPGCGADNWEIYGNIFHDAGTWSFPRFLAFQNSATGTVHVYNNSFINAGTFGCYSAEGGTPTGAADNNIYFGNSFHGCGFPFTEDWGASDGTTGMTNGQNNLNSSFFVNSAAKTVAGYNLSKHTNPGLTTLGSPYNVDYNGNTRTTWDRGFVEFSSGGVTLVSITLSPTTMTLANGQTATATASCLWSDSTTVCPSLTWVTGSSLIATVSSSGVGTGLVTGVSTGGTLISAFNGGVTSTNTISVTETGPQPTQSGLLKGQATISGNAVLK